MKEFGIVVFGHTRPFVLGDTLESLRRQDALQFVDLWIDGDQGIPELRKKVALTQQVADRYDVAVRRYHRGQLGFRKIILQAMQSAAANYRHILFLEDDCFPSRDAVRIFREELSAIEYDDEVFSVYGHPFLMAEESGYCSRFQGWGWATTSSKLKPYLDELINLYSISEAQYLEFVNQTMDSELLTILDVTPPRLPSKTLKAFYAWDETLALITARDRKKHKLAKERIIFNCGLGADASRFTGGEYFNPPFNMILPEDVWEHF